MQPRPRTSLLVLVVVITTAMAPSAGGASCEDGTPAAFFLLRTDDLNNPCTLPFLRVAPAVVHVYIDVYAVPFRIARFSLPDPPVGYFAQETWFYPHTGDRVNGIEIDLGSCSISETVTVGYLTIYVFDTANCVPWRVDDGAEIEDCTSVTYAGQEWPYQITTQQWGCPCCLECFPSLPPHSMYPSDGATNVPINVELSWELPFDPETAPEPPHCDVRISTDPACETGQTFSVDCSDQTFSPDFLVPGTTYYWQATAGFPRYYGQSPIFSFTTEDAVSAMPTTWGRVKAIYSD